MTAPNRLVIRHGTVVTLGADCKVLPDYAVVCDEGRISRIVPDAEAIRLGGRELDVRGQVVMPGLINAHMHFYSTLVRGLGAAEPSRT